MSQAEIGVIGMGVMGSNLALNIAEKGFKVAIWNRNDKVTQEVIGHAGPLAANLVKCNTYEELIAAIKPPRPVIILITAGPAVDQVIGHLQPLMQAQDIIIDAGNANFHDTMRRVKELKNSQLNFIGMGVSGGEEGARHGPSIMVGGKDSSWHRVEKVLTAISAKYKGVPCAAYMGPNGAGHFVKTIHNGIEYGDMQMISEVYGLMRDGLGMKAAEIAKVFHNWNKGRLNSYLIEITQKVLSVIDAIAKKPLVDVIVDRAGQKGTGKWAAIESQTLGVNASAIEAAVDARIISSMKDERVKADKAYKIPSKKISKASRAKVLKQLEGALYAGKIAAYAQGFAVLEAASKQYDWNLPLGTVAAIWRGGCIIRSQFLGEITKACSKTNSGNLLMAPAFIKMMKKDHMALRAMVALSATSGAPAPALSNALSYFDGYRQARGSANLIQAQRDFFGAHGFERIGETGAFHGPWAMNTGK
ncbi:MAG: NADP-dependent phosphogluconate dehydrogenase [Pseudomonadota bacterium]|nr:NADP-dependent phosphogluconate dehydrogenase [Pseudomonadota bacterium]